MLNVSCRLRSVCPLRFPAVSWVGEMGVLNSIGKGWGWGGALWQSSCCHSLGPRFNHQHHRGRERERKRTMFRLASRILEALLCRAEWPSVLQGLGSSLPSLVAVSSLHGCLSEMGIECMKGSQLSTDTRRKN